MHNISTMTEFHIFLWICDHSVALFERMCITDLRMTNDLQQLYNNYHDCHSATKVFIYYVSKHVHVDNNKYNNNNNNNKIQSL